MSESTIEEKVEPGYRTWESPLYRVRWEFINGSLMVVADKIGESGWNKDIASTHPITGYATLGCQKTVWIDVGPAPFLEYNISELDEAIVEAEREVFHTPAAVGSEEHINAYLMGRQTGRCKGYVFEFGVEFFNIDVDTSLDYKLYKEMKERIESKPNR